ncbi:MAG: penicillin acylase family protein [Micromonosporaceae bacterium]
MRTPRIFISIVTAALLLGLAGPGGATSTYAPAADYGEVLNVMPPGQSGTVTATGLATVLAGDPVNRIAVDGKNAPRNFANQWEMYDALNRLSHAEIRDADLTRYYKASVFDVPPDQVLKVEQPKAGVTITWDSYGVPHIKGATYSDVAWGAGYAGTRDRMFLQDVLRHTGAARSAEFLGGTDANIAMDQSVLRSSYYTEEEAAAQIERIRREYGAEGDKLAAAGAAYVAGINAAQSAMCPVGLPTGLDCPAEYAALGKTPKPWKLTDVVYIAGLVGGIFGKGGGAEYGNAMLLQKLQKRFGETQGRRVYEDLRGRNDPEAPTTTTTRWRYGGGAVDPDAAGVALPDPEGAPTAPGTGATSDAADPGLTNLLTGDPAPIAGKVDAPFGTIDLTGATHGMSNAALVSGEHTADGHPVMVAGPQTGHFAPQLWTEMSLEGPGIKARGVAFAGTNIVVQVGRGVDYAWSPTSAGFDNVDTVAERLCEPDGSPATVESTHYRRDGECVPIEIKTHRETALPNPGAPGAPRQLEFTVMRTHHGIVQLRTTVDGEPVALVHQRSTYHREVSSLVGFARANDPGYVTGAASFQRAVHKIDYTFNWQYADSRDIAYFGSGLLPHRAADTTLDLPRWGDGAYDWRGWLSFDEHLHQINPPRGYLISWNNKPGLGPSPADDAWDHGSVHRSLALSDRVAPLVRAGGVTRHSLLAAVQEAALVDTRAAKTLPYLLAVIGDDPEARPAAELLRAWLADGAPREDRDRDGAYSHAAAIALFDEWWESAPTSEAGRGRYALARDVLRGGLGATVDGIGHGIDDHPRAGNASSWLGPPWYGWVNKDLRQLLGEPVTGRWSRSYCGDGALAACRTAVRDSLAGAVRRALDAQGVSDVAALTYDKHEDDITPVAAGLVGVRPIDWQNRPTFQQVACFTSHR